MPNVNAPSPWLLPNRFIRWGVIALFTGFTVIAWRCL